VVGDLRPVDHSAGLMLRVLSPIHSTCLGVLARDKVCDGEGRVRACIGATT
jgi:hypothetical protein